MVIIQRWFIKARPVFLIICQCIIIYILILASNVMPLCDFVPWHLDTFVNSIQKYKGLCYFKRCKGGCQAGLNKYATTPTPPQSTHRFALPSNKQCILHIYFVCKYIAYRHTSCHDTYMYIKFLLTRWLLITSFKYMPSSKSRNVHRVSLVVI